MLCVSPKKPLGLQVPGYVFLKDGTKLTLFPEKPGVDSGRSSPGCEPGPMGWGKGTKPEPQAGAFMAPYGQKIKSQKRVAAANHITIPSCSPEERFPSLQLKTTGVPEGETVAAGPQWEPGGRRVQRRRLRRLLLLLLFGALVTAVEWNSY